MRNNKYKEVDKAAEADSNIIKGNEMINQGTMETIVQIDNKKALIFILSDAYDEIMSYWREVTEKEYPNAHKILTAKKMIRTDDWLKVKTELTKEEVEYLECAITSDDKGNELIEYEGTNISISEILCLDNIEIYNAYCLFMGNSSWIADEIYNNTIFSDIDINDYSPEAKAFIAKWDEIPEE